MPTKNFDPLPLIADPLAQDELFNEGTSALLSYTALFRGPVGRYG